MDQAQLITRPLSELIRQLDTRQLKSSLKSSYRRVGNGVRRIAVKYLRQTGMDVQGDQSDWEKGIRVRVYSRGGGFMITTKAHAASKAQMRQGNPGLGMHKNRKGWYKPILMWAAEGTKKRYQRYKRKGYYYGAHKDKRGLVKSGLRHYVRTTGLPTGSMPNYGFIDKATPEAYQYVEKELGKEVETAVNKKARKVGLLN